MSYRDTLDQVGDATAAKVTAIVTSWQEGLLEEQEAVALIAAAIAAANSRATALADLALAATLTLALRRPVPTLGLTPPADDAGRLARAAQTLLAVEDLTDERAARLGRSEPLTRAQEARGEGLVRSRHVTGWVRDTGGEACELCTWWARDGAVWPDDHPMPTHKGCKCSQTPVTKEDA